MRKLWDHYEPLPLDDYSEAPVEEPLEPAHEREKTGILTRARNWLFRAETDTAVPFRLHRRSFRKATHPDLDVMQALQRWKAAMTYFENVSDPALVDYAAYDMQAAQRRYIYLLKQAGQEQQKLDKRQDLPLT